MWTIAKVIRATSLVATMLFLAGINVIYGQHDGHQHNSAQAMVVDLMGRVLCADGPALPGAVVQIFKTTPNGEQLQASALSDEDGRFRLRAPAGTYNLRIAFLGHANQSQPIEVATGARSINLGAITLKISAVELEAIVAAADKDRVRLKSGYTVFDAQRSSAASGTVADVLRTVPNLDLDEHGRVTLRGSTSVLVMINGRRAVLKDEALIAFLRQMPASALARVDVSTTASAKQDAEGHAGVVNLEFKSNTSSELESAYSLSASVATAAQFLASGNATGGAGRVAWDASYAVSMLTPQTRSHTMRDNFLVPGAGRTTHQESAADAKHLLHTLNAGSALQLTDGNHIAARGGFSWMRGDYDNVTRFADIGTTGNWTSSSLTASELAHTIPTSDASLVWSYRHPSLGNLRWTTELRYARGLEQFHGRYRDEAGSEFLATDMDLKRGELVIQNDAAFDLAGLRVETGHKTHARRLDATFATRRADERSDALDMRETVTAFYSSLSRVLGQVFVQAGVRGENTSTSLSLSGYGSSETEFRWFPSLALHWPHAETSATQFQLAFGRRTQRPDFASLNPFAMGEDDMNSFIGNPHLEPEITDLIELAVVRRFNAVTLQATPYIRATYDPIRPLKAVTASGQATTTLVNLDRARATGMDISISARPHERVQAMLSSNVFYAESRAADIRSHGFYYHLRASVDVTVAPRTTLQLYGHRRSAQPIEQGEMLPTFNSDVALTRRWGAEDQGALTVRVSDPFDSNRLAFHLTDAAFAQHSERKITSRMLSVFISWTIGGAASDHRQPTPEEMAPRIF